MWTPWGDLAKCPVVSGGTVIMMKGILGAQQSVLNTDVSLFQECPLRGVPLYALYIYALYSDHSSGVYEQ